MASVRLVVALQLVGLLVSSLYSNGQGVLDEEQQKIIFRRAPPPAPLPGKSPSPLPGKSPPPPAPVPAPPPAKTPPPPPFKLSSAVEGVVYCFSCKLPGYLPNLNASPLRGAIAKLVCTSRRGYTSNGNATSDPKGYFMIKVQNKRPSAVSACKVVLDLPAWCNKPVFPKNATSGVPVKFERADKVGASRWVFFTTGFLEFAPARTGLCPRRGH